MLGGGAVPQVSKAETAFAEHLPLLALGFRHQLQEAITSDTLRYGHHLQVGILLAFSPFVRLGDGWLKAALRARKRICSELRRTRFVGVPSTSHRARRHLLRELQNVTKVFET